MPQITIPGSAGSYTVSAIAYTSDQIGIAAQTSLNNILSLLSSGVIGINITNGVTTNLPIVGSITGSSIVDIGIVDDNIKALLIDSIGKTTVSNSRSTANQSVIAAAGGLTFTDNGASTVLVVGGGTNTINFGSGSTNASFIGDGANTLNISTAFGATSIFGTSASSDTIVGAVGGGNVVYTSAAGSRAFINPGADNVTVFGSSGAGTATVFGGSSVNTFTGRLTVVDGTGYFQGGTAGNNILGSSTVGSTTLIGGGGDDILTARGANDVLVAGAGAATLDGSHSSGKDTFFASSTGTSLMYGGTSSGDTFFTNNSTISGVGFTGSFIDLHTAPNALFHGLNSNVSNFIGIGFSGNGANYGTISDFISGVDKLVLNTSVTGSSYSLTSGVLVGSNGPVTYTNMQTANGSFITVYNSVIKSSDITKV